MVFNWKLIIIINSFPIKLVIEIFIVKVILSNHSIKHKKHWERSVRNHSGTRPGDKEIYFFTSRNLYLPHPFLLDDERTVWTVPGYFTGKRHGWAKITSRLNPERWHSLDYATSAFTDQHFMLTPPRTPKKLWAKIACRSTLDDTVSPRSYWYPQLNADQPRSWNKYGNKTNEKTLLPLPNRPLAL